MSAQISAYGSQLQYLLAGPDALDLLPRSPALLRRPHPLCRALAVAVPAELLPLRKRRWNPPQRESRDQFVILST